MTTSASESDKPTRRQVLNGSLVAGSAVLLGVGAVGTAAANGKGGRVAVPDEFYRGDGSRLHFVKFTGSGKLFKCDIGGNGIVLAEWQIYYEDDPDSTQYVYTRDNAIDTSKTYKFTDQATDCGGFYLTSFVPTTE